MKNYNLKQLTASQRRVSAYVNRIARRFILVVMFVFVLQGVAYAINTDSSITDKIEAIIQIGGGIGYASMLAIGNIKDVPDRDVSGEAISYKVWLINLDQINDNVAFPTPNASREIATIPLKIGQKMVYFEAHDIPEHTASGERGNLTISATNTFNIVMGGLRDQLLTFIEEHAGDKFIIIYQECGKTEKYILGTPCKPMVLKNFSLNNNKESRSVTFTFENKSIRQFCKYTGSIIAVEPVTLAPGATTLAIQSGVDVYNISNGTSSAAAITAVTGLTSSDKGRIITLVGLGSNHPATVADNAVFVLEDGTTWTARAGSQLTLRVLDSATLVEIGKRIQTA